MHKHCNVAYFLTKTGLSRGPVSSSSDPEYSSYSEDSSWSCPSSSPLSFSSSTPSNSWTQHRPWHSVRRDNNSTSLLCVEWDVKLYSCTALWFNVAAQNCTKLMQLSKEKNVKDVMQHYHYFNMLHNDGTFWILILQTLIALSLC